MPSNCSSLTARSIAAMLIALLVGAAGAVQGADIVLKQKIVPTKSVVSLGDIADIQADDGGTARRLALTPLWPSPPEGEQRFVTAREVRDQLVRHGFDNADLHFFGTSRVTIGLAAPKASLQNNRGGLTRSILHQANEKQPVSRSTRSVGSGTGFRPRRAIVAPTMTRRASLPVAALTEAQRDGLHDQVREAVTGYLKKNTGKTGSLGVEFKLQTRQYNQLATQQSELTVSGGRSPWLGRQNLVVEFTSERGLQKLRVVTVTWDTTPVVRVQRPLSRGQTITAADVMLQSPQADTRMPAGRTPLYSLDEALGKEASRMLRVGEVATAEVCLAPMMISRNEIVTVVSAGGGIVIRRQAKAMANARQGDMAEVELIGTKERLAARVVGPGRLAIYSGGMAARRSADRATAARARADSVTR